MLLWHQFTTVVILKQNMRQATNSPEDNKLRAALERMRFKECTQEDIAFLKSRIPAYNPDIRFNKTKWKYVLVITALNAHKAQINHMNAIRFVREQGQTLHYFYSMDKVSQETALTRRMNRLPA
jgi:hypothetical protein